MGLIKQLRDSKPFNLLPEPLFEELRTAARLERYPAGTCIFRQNDPPTGYLYVIKEGLVEITVLSPDGFDMAVDVRREGHFFGGTPIFTGEPYTGGARAVRDSECYLIPQEILHRAKESCPQLTDYFSRIVYSRMRRLYQEYVADQSRSSGVGDPYPFKKRVAEIMSAVTTVPAHTPAAELLPLLLQAPESAVVVAPAAGLITPHELLAALAAGADLGQTSAGAIMSPIGRSVSSAGYMYEAIADLLGCSGGPLPVIDDGTVVGLVTLRDALRTRSQQSLQLLGSVRQAKHLPQLATVRRELLPLGRTLLAETRSTPEVMEVLSHIHHSIIRRTFELCLAEQIANRGTPPEVRYCLLILGSGGRREMLLAPDQDSALIFEDFPQAQRTEVESYFAPLLEQFSTALAGVGYPLCEGQVMASNPVWRGRLQDWRTRIHSWIENPEPQQVRYSSIFFDFAPLYGDTSLAASLRDIVQHEVAQNQSFLYQMMTLDLSYKVPLGLLGRFLLEKSGEHRGELSLKQGGSIYLVDCIRIFALERGLAAATTLARLDGLVAQNIFAAETAAHIRAAFEALTFLRLRQEIAQLSDGLPPSHFLAPDSLAKNEQDLLREALNAVSKLQDATKRHFGRTPF